MQMTIDDWLARDFQGKTYDPKHDRHRLSSQYMRVFNLMKDGRWRTLAEIREVVGGSEAGISARLRDFRKAVNGGHVVDDRRQGKSGVWEYRLTPSTAHTATIAPTPSPSVPGCTPA